MRVLDKIYDALVSGRRKGYSSEMKKIADSRNDVYIICTNMESAKRFGNKGIAMHELDCRGNDRMYLLDNHTLLELLSAVKDKLSDQQLEITKFVGLVRDIDRKIKEFKYTSNSFKHERLVG